MELQPDDVGPIFGHQAAREAFLSALTTGKLHHGWLMRGPRGVGKARLALRFALKLFGDSSDFTSQPDPALAKLVLAGNHPDLRVIRRPIDDKGKQKSEIPVDSVRDLAQFFSLRPALGGWRVAIIDAVDEMNRFGANAVLKTLEEPPARAVLFLVSHGEQALLPTVRSRCRILRCDALGERDELAVLAAAGSTGTKATTIANLAPGRPGRALELAQGEVDDSGSALESLLRSDGAVEASALQTALSHVAKSDGALAVSMERLRNFLQRRAMREGDPARAGEWADAALAITRIGVEAQTLNQDRAQTIAAALNAVSGRLSSAGG
jgi:DNA polymerase-3 subunit delta'